MLMRIQAANLKRWKSDLPLCQHTVYEYGNRPQEENWPKGGITEIVL
jgi:hypothetical protein